MPKADKEKQAAQIRDSIGAFREKHFNEEYLGYACKLLDTLKKKRTLDIARGKSEIWAASIVYVIARLNFLFDPKDPHYMSADTICDFFGTKKSTVSNKASVIEKTCQIGIGAKGYCRQEISDMFTFVELPNGFIAPKSSLNKREIVIEILEGEEAEELERLIAQREEEEKDRIAEKQKKIADEKRRKRNKDQPNLFDDDV